MSLIAEALGHRIAGTLLAFAGGAAGMLAVRDARRHPVNGLLGAMAIAACGLLASDWPLALVCAVLLAISALWSLRLPHDAGAEVTSDG